MYLLRMPKADENMAEGTLVRWLVDEGADVTEGQNVCECVADKGEFMIYPEESGSVLRIYAPAQSVVPVGYVLAAVGSPDEAVPDVEAENAALLKETRRRIAATPGLEAREAGRVRATPAARRLAREEGVSLARVAAAVGGKVIRISDVEAFARGRGTSEEGGT